MARTHQEHALHVVTVSAMPRLSLAVIFILVAITDVSVVVGMSVAVAVPTSVRFGRETFVRTEAIARVSVVVSRLRCRQDGHRA